MTRRSARMHTRSENVPIQKGKVTKSNWRKAHPLPKRQNEKSQLVLEGVANPCILIETPEKTVSEACEEPIYVTLTSRDACVQPCPLPFLSWGCPQDVWEKMVGKEQKYTHRAFIEQHPNIGHRMRSILLDWLIEVSEVYTLHRQTFYLAQDYFDRFMLTQNNIEKDKLQLIGITCLFMASKVEEIYPPKVAQMAYVTDGCCLEYQILQMELIILKALNWNLCPETALSWLNLYIQMAAMSEDSDLLEPKLMLDVYVRVTRLLDLCILDITSLDFSYRILAAAALHTFLPVETVQKVSGLSWEAVDSCIDWMSPFAEAFTVWEGPGPRVELKHFDNVRTEDRHNIQTHASYISMLDEAQLREMEYLFLTPPNSTEKALAR